MPLCELSGKKPVVKNKVSHSNIKTKSRAFPNVQVKRFYSPCLKKFFRLKVAAAAIRSIDKCGGIDTFLIRSSNNQLSPFALKLKKQLTKKQKPSKTVSTKDVQ